MKRILLISLLCTLNIAQAQLIKSYGTGCMYTESPVYIMNDDNVIYQDCNSRKILYPHRATFRQPRYNEIGVAMDKNGIYYQGILIPIDTTGFTVVGRNNNYSDYLWIWKNKDSVYLGTKVVKGADAKTFTHTGSLNGSYFKDKNSIYFFKDGLKKIEGSDGSSAVSNYSVWIYDKNMVYVDGKPLLYKGEKVKPVNESLAKTSSAVINTSQQPVNGLDPSSLKGLSRHYAIDRNGVYWRGEKTPIKPAYFKDVKVWDQVNRAYITDGLTVYSGAGMAEKDFDAKTFGMLPHSDFCYDKKGVYERKWDEPTQSVINIKFPFVYSSPVSTNNLFITDNSRYIVYMNQAFDPWDKKLYKNLTGEQVEWLRQGKLELNEVHAHKTPIKRIDPMFYVQDNVLTTRNGGKIYQFPTIDAATFQSLNYTYVKDKKHVYCIFPELQKLPADAASASMMYGLLKDKDNIYYNGKPILSSKGAALLATFPGYRPGCGMDNHPTSDYYFIRNQDGYYLIEVTHPKPSVHFLGRTFSEDWDAKFVGFELP
jgi:hypothetical protein